MEASVNYQVTSNDQSTVNDWIAADCNDRNFAGYTQLDENGDVVLPD